MTDRLIYKGHVKLVHREHDGRLFDVVISKNACAILYIDPDDNVYFCRQYRVALGREVIELPAETMDKPGKTSLEVIVEGLEEECGIKIDATQVKYFATIESSGGHDTEMVDLYYATGPCKTTKQMLEHDERITVVKIPFKRAYNMIATGEITGSKSIALLQNEYIRRLGEKTSRS